MLVEDLGHVLEACPRRCCVRHAVEVLVDDLAAWRAAAAADCQEKEPPRQSLMAARPRNRMRASGTLDAISRIASAREKRYLTARLVGVCAWFRHWGRPSRRANGGFRIDVFASPRTRWLRGDGQRVMGDGVMRGGGGRLILSLASARSPRGAEASRRPRCSDQRAEEMLDGLEHVARRCGRGASRSKRFTGRLARLAGIWWAWGRLVESMVERYRRRTQDRLIEHSASAAERALRRGFLIAVLAPRERPLTFSSFRGLVPVSAHTDHRRPPRQSTARPPSRRERTNPSSALGCVGGRGGDGARPRTISGLSRPSVAPPSCCRAIAPSRSSPDDFLR